MVSMAGSQRPLEEELLPEFPAAFEECDATSRSGHSWCPDWSYAALQDMRTAGFSMNVAGPATTSFQIQCTWSRQANGSAGTG
jgi:hypothetical protein